MPVIQTSGRVLVLIALAGSVIEAQATGKTVGAPRTVGTVHLATSCAPAAHPPFQRAVALLHSFAFAQATTNFTLAVRADPGCAMASWGLALTAWGNPFAAGLKARPQIERGLAAVQQARAAGTTSPREQGYLDAVARLFGRADSIPQRMRVASYRDAMTALAEREPADTEAQIFAALAVSIAADPTDKTYAAQLTAGATLDRLFAKLPDHPGLAHYIIHAYDVAPLAKRALGAATSYGRIAPEVSHALHMPSHTYTRVGLWQQSIATNVASGSAARREGSTAEELHADDYRMSAYLQLAQDRTAAQLLASLPSVSARFDPTATGTGAPPAAGFFAMAAMPARYALERGDWAGAARLEVRPSPFLFADAITWFARALGAARTGDTLRADAAIVALTGFRERLLAASEGYWAEQVEIQRLGALAWRTFAAGQRDSALTLMRTAAAHEDATEKNAITPGPLAPARELLGDMLMSIGDHAGARAAYEATLLKEPNRFRAVAGAASAALAAGDRAAARVQYRALLGLARPEELAARPVLARARGVVAGRP